jgi:hypothetical protein
VYISSFTLVSLSVVATEHLMSYCDWGAAKAGTTGADNSNATAAVATTLGTLMLQEVAAVHEALHAHRIATR